METVNDPLNVFLVEDDEVDREAVKRAFNKLMIPINIAEASDGQEALEILRGESDASPPPQPFVILLDINMPQMDGIEFLRRLRTEMPDPKYSNAIVFMLTTSDAEKDRERAYAHHVAGYLVKSNARGGLSGIAEMLHSYRQVVAFP